jgi:short-subunit dehydrogenase
VFELVQAGHIKLTPPTLYDYFNIEAAFRHTQQSPSLRKTVLSISEASTVKVMPRDIHPLKLDPKVCYVLVGGLGGLGRGLSTYMSKCGAQNLAFISRSGATKPEAQATLKELESLGTRTSAYACDITDRLALATTLKQIAQDMPPIKGVVQAAMVLKDGLFETMSYNDWTSATKPKIEGTWNLHELIPEDLDFFVILSSASGIVGNRAQSNYAVGNTYEDALAHYRRSLGLPATVIDLGAVGDIGWLQEHKDDKDSIGKWMKQVTITSDEFFAVFKSTITGYSFNNDRLPTQIMTGLGSGGLEKLALASGAKEYYWLHDSARFAYLRLLDLKLLSNDKEQGKTAELKDSLQAATSIAQATDLVAAALAEKIARSMMVSVEEIDLNRQISSYGVDSLVAAELRNWCFKDLKSDIMVFEFLSNVALTVLARQIAEKSTLLSSNIEK